MAESERVDEVATYLTPPPWVVGYLLGVGRLTSDPAPQAFILELAVMHDPDAPRVRVSVRMQKQVVLDLIHDLTTLVVQLGPDVPD